MEEIFDLKKRGFHNDLAAETAVITSKPAEFKVKREIHLTIANRLTRLSQPIAI
jgi:hypothetical protein